MALKELVALLRRRAPEVEEVLEGVGYQDPDVSSSVYRPNPAVHPVPPPPIREEAPSAPVTVHPARGTAEAMGERWEAQGDDEAPEGDTCLDCKSAFTGMPCPTCRGCGECCMCFSAGMLDVGLR